MLDLVEQLLMRPVDDYEVVSALLKCMWDLLIRPVHEESPLVSGILAKVLKKHGNFWFRMHTWKLEKIQSST